MKASPRHVSGFLGRAKMVCGGLPLAETESCFSLSRTNTIDSHSGCRPSGVWSQYKYCLAAVSSSPARSSLVEYTHARHVLTPTPDPAASAMAAKNLPSVVVLPCWLQPRW